MADTDSAKNKKPDSLLEIVHPPTEEISVSQGWQVFTSGIVGSIFGIAPAIFYTPAWGVLISGNVYWVFGIAPGFFLIPGVRIITLVSWACLIGIPFTAWWSRALHKRVEFLRLQLNSINAPLEEQAQHPERLPWMPAWIGVFERAFYCLLIGLNVTGGAAFIGVWIGLKSAGGWQIWSKGTTYGRAVLFAGLLGDAMSILFGVVAGLVVRFYTATP
jgi:hypothetical protein